MSHVVKVEIEIKDLQCLKLACEELGLELMQGQKTFKSYQVGQKCAHAIRVKGNHNAYEIGVRQEADGTFGLVWDSWSGGYGLVAKVGESCSLLKGAYAKQVAKQAVKAAAKKYGFSGYSETVDAATGEVKIRITKF